MAIVPYQERVDPKKKQVADMFDSISPKYDLLNRVLSFGIDIYWRKVAIGMLKALKPKRILDIATGTADVAIETLNLKPEQVIGVDISEGMLALGREKLARQGITNIELRYGDSENLQFMDGAFDAVTVAFGVRNFENLDQGLLEMLRVLRPGGKAVILEFSQPQAFPIKQLYAWYSFTLLPLLGRMVSKDASAYTYLPESVAAFPQGNEFLTILKRLGYGNVHAKRLTFGVVSVYSGEKLA